MIKTLPVTELNPCKLTYKMSPEDLTCCFEKKIFQLIMSTEQIVLLNWGGGEGGVEV